MTEEQKRSIIFRQKIGLQVFGLCHYFFTVIFEIFRTIQKNKDNMAPKVKDNIEKSLLSL